MRYSVGAEPATFDAFLRAIEDWSATDGLPIVGPPSRAALLPPHQAARLRAAWTQLIERVEPYTDIDERDYGHRLWAWLVVAELPPNDPAAADEALRRIARGPLPRWGRRGLAMAKVRYRHRLRLGDFDDRSVRPRDAVRGVAK